MKCYLKCVQILLLLLAISCHAQANNQKEAKVLLYIQAQEYEHPVKLWQYFKDHWFTQGPLVEAAAEQVLSQQFGEVAMCPVEESASASTAAMQQSNAGQLLVWLRPRIFYNPQSQVFYAKITAVAYDQDGKLIETFVGEANKFGFLDIKPELQLNQVYVKSMQIIADKMWADNKIQTALKQAISTHDNCAMVNLLPTPKIQFMSF